MQHVLACLNANNGKLVGVNLLLFLFFFGLSDIMWRWALGSLVNLSCARLDVGLKPWAKDGREALNGIPYVKQAMHLCLTGFLLSHVLHA